MVLYFDCIIFYTKIIVVMTNGQEETMLRGQILSYRLRCNIALFTRFAFLRSHSEVNEVLYQLLLERGKGGTVKNKRRRQRKWL